MKLKGMNGVLTADDEKISISRKTLTGFIMQGIKGDRVIYYKDMTSIEFKKPTKLANGYIQFIVNPELAVNQKVGIIGTSTKALQDPNSVALRAFKKSTANECENFYKYVKENLDKVQATSHKENNSKSVADELIKLNELKKEGILTQEEFDSQKEKLLSE